MKIIAHRGARNHAPENTLAAFKKALEIGVDAIELDVFVLPSGEIVVMHDIMVNRTTNGAGYVANFDFDELRRLNAGDDEQVPTLNEVIDLVDRQVPIIIELKAPNTAEPVAQLLKEYFSKGWQTADFEVISFNHPEVMKFHEALPEVRFGASVASIPIDYAAYAEHMGANIVMLCMEFVNPEFIADAHARGLTVYGYAWEPFTADLESEIDRIHDLHIDGWVSERPDVAKAYLQLKA